MWRFGRAITEGLTQGSVHKNTYIAKAIFQPHKVIYFITGFWSIYSTYTERRSANMKNVARYMARKKNIALFCRPIHINVWIKRTVKAQVLLKISPTCPINVLIRLLAFLNEIRSKSSFFIEQFCDSISNLFATDENSKSRVWRTASVFRSINKMCETTCLKERDGFKPIVRRFARLFYSARRHISTPYYLDERKHHRFIQLMGTWVELQLKLLTNPTKKVD